MQNHVNILNEEFNRLVFQFNSEHRLLKNTNDKQNAFNWGNKLRMVICENLEEYKLRNLLFTALIRQLYIGELTAPFNTIPGFQKLDDLNLLFPNINVKANLLEKPVTMTENFRLPKIMERSPDYGAFLLTQPVPKCGAFCYLAVVSRPPK